MDKGEGATAVTGGEGQPGVTVPVLVMNGSSSWTICTCAQSRGPWPGSLAQRQQNGNGVPQTRHVQTRHSMTLDGVTVETLGASPPIPTKTANTENSSVPRPLSCFIIMISDPHTEPLESFHSLKFRRRQPPTPN
ncbi:uncharacterized protein N7482_002828 [Penicillium canariense]|uniref:Uncharacterized protein n=1 Tax=Penicillium canariense TaxID=189055 RepID=A0A9W9IMF7_9EURO|nr:uncharacterized protein N7482_002828 [Penicillium canariense]KAJ5176951.1 hypothetical protein N7482_002828 [Penicillium canariense]